MHRSTSSSTGMQREREKRGGEPSLVVVVRQKEKENRGASRRKMLAMQDRLRIHPDFYNDFPDERPVPFVEVEEDSVNGDRSLASTLTGGTRKLRDDIVEIADCDKTYEPTLPGTVSDIQTIDEGRTLDIVYGGPCDVSNERSFHTVSDIVTVESGGIPENRIGAQQNKHLPPLYQCPSILVYKTESVSTNKAEEPQDKVTRLVQRGVFKRARNRCVVRHQQEGGRIQRSLPQLLRCAIRTGAPLYNQGNHRACYEIYMEAAEEAIHHQSAAELAPNKVSLRDMLRLDLSQARGTIAIENSGFSHSKAAWILRRCFDTILSLSKEPQQRFEI